MGFWNGLWEALCVWGDVRIVDDRTAPTFDRIMAQRRLEVRAAEKVRAANERREAEEAEETAKRDALFEELDQAGKRLEAYRKVEEYDQAAREADVFAVVLERVKQAGWLDCLSHSYLSSFYRVRGGVYHARAGRGLPSREADYAAAEHSYTTAARLMPDDPRPPALLGMVALHRGRYDEVVERLTQAIRLQPDYPLAYQQRGRAHYELRRYDEAVRDFGTVWQLDPSNREAEADYRSAWKAALLAMEGAADEAVRRAAAEQQSAYSHVGGGEEACRAARATYWSHAIALYTDVLTRAKGCPAGGPALKKG